MDPGPEDLGRAFSKEYLDAVANLGRFNLAVFGKTGSGKSTLINAIFGMRVAATGTGPPITTGLNYYEHPSGLLGLLDSQGFETGHAGDAVLAGIEQIVSRSREQPVDRHIHAAWYLLRWSDRRFETAQAAFVGRLAQMVPVVFVISQVPVSGDGRIHSDALELADYVERQGLPLSPDGRVVFTNALADPFLATDVYGLHSLLEATMRTAPEAARRALSAAQLIDRERKRQACSSIIRSAVASATATGVTPIPFSDAAILVPLQISMLAKITAEYGLSVPSARLASLIGSLMLSSGATTAGRWLVASLLRAVPGGQIPAMAISGAVAGSLTRAIGWAWVRVCERLLAGGGFDGGEKVVVQRIFREEFRARFRIDRAAGTRTQTG